MLRTRWTTDKGYGSRGRMNNRGGYNNSNYRNNRYGGNNRQNY